VIEFAKLSGSGNDFVCIDNLDGRFDQIVGDPDRVGVFARSLCHRGTGVGADGVIFAVRPEIEGFADIGARFLEADGSEAELCGNGTACFARWAADRGFADDSEMRILTSAGVVRAKPSDGLYVLVCIPDPEELQLDVQLKVLDIDWRCDFVVVGIPHCVTYVDEVGGQDVAKWGPLLRHHERFRPRGVNANFVEIIKRGEIAMRTYEYGVEGETLACGTGAAASSILSAVHFDWGREYLTGEKPVLVRAQSGDVLRVSFKRLDDGLITDVCLETVVRSIYSGVLHPDLAAAVLPAEFKL
jgi:diaminopimelate epimerase